MDLESRRSIHGSPITSQSIPPRICSPRAEVAKGISIPIVLEWPPKPSSSHERKHPWIQMMTSSTFLTRIKISRK
jgi:hypothetical protein